nr:tyrosine-type recombinase/integrase [Dechloromonas sp.]
MALTDILIRSTLGVLSPRYRTVADWSEVYRRIIDTKPVCDKTKANRMVSVRHILDGIGRRIISRVMPHEIAELVQRLHAEHPALAKRVLIEAKSLFNEAVIYGWIDRNPAFPLRAPAVHVQRHRLSLEHWQAIHAYALANQPHWVARMLVLALVSAQRRSDLEKMQPGDVWDDHLHIQQAKTGMRLALPLSLRLDAIGVSLGEAIEDCRDYAVGNSRLLRKHNGRPIGVASMSARFEEAREGSGLVWHDGLPPSLHECRSLSERLYRAQGVNTMILLGHKNQAMTDIYDDDRDLAQGQWKTLSIQKPQRA